jgi:hypothetical protein
VWESVRFSISIKIDVEHSVSGNIMHVTLLTFLRNADFVASIVADGAVLCFAFPAYRRAKMPAFAFLVWGSVIGIILEVGLQFHRASTGTAQDAVAFSEWYRVGYFAAIVLWGIGIVQLIQYVRRDFERKTPPHATPKRTTTVAPVSGESANPNAGDLPTSPPAAVD